MKPDVLQVGFKLLGFIPGFVGLRGKLKPVDDGKDTVRVDFEPAEICIAGDSLRVGRSSDVTLKTTFLDERVRLGQGSRGSLFVFTRGGPSDTAGGLHLCQNLPHLTNHCPISVRRRLCPKAVAFYFADGSA